MPNPTSSLAASLVARVRGTMRLVLLALALSGPLVAAAQAPARAVSERSVKAAFLYKFASYVEWPGSASAGESPIVIGVLGDDDFADELQNITAGRTVSNRPITIRRLDDDDPVTSAGVDILFIADEEREELERVLAATAQQPILMVTESPDAIEHGSVINFIVDAERVRFEVSLYAAELRQLRLNARLLAVAQQVRKAPE